MARLEGPPPTKEFFSPATAGTKPTIFWNHPCYRLIADADAAYVEFMIPHDFHKLVMAELVWIAEVSLTGMFIEGIMGYGGHNESCVEHIHGCNVTRNTVGSRIYRDDVSAGLAAAAPLDHVCYCGSRPSNGNAEARILGVRVRYV